MMKEDEMIRRSIWASLALGIPALVAVVAARAHYRPSGAAPVLAEAYTLRLASDWPDYPGESPSCNNSGAEVLEGTVTRLDGYRYAGRFTRASRLGFCGAHSAAQPTACGLQLRGRDTVKVDAVAFDAGRGPELRVRWRGTVAGAVVVDGTCSDRFKQALERMYREAVHEVELPIGDDVGNTAMRLGDYPWIATVNR
jgi:hypothetical protein